MPKQETSLIYHINLNHVSLTEKQRTEYVDWVLPEMINQLQVKAHISVPAEDLLFLSRYHPDTFSALVGNEHVTFLHSTFAHTIADHSYGVYNEQLRKGTSLFKQLLPEHKIAPVLYPSEVELPQPLTNSMENIQAIVLGESRVQNGRTLPTHFSSELNGREYNFRISPRYCHYRDVLHKYFREEVSSRSVIAAILADEKMFGEFVARIDLEVALLNEIFFPDGKTSGPRLDLWAELMQQLQSSSITFTHLSEGDTDIARVAPSALQHSTAEDKKWSGTEIEELIASAQKDPLNPKYDLWLSAHASDYLYAHEPDLSFKARNGRISIIKNPQQRLRELQQKIDVISENSTPGNTDTYIDQIIALNSNNEAYATS